MTSKNVLSLSHEAFSVSIHVSTSQRPESLSHTEISPDVPFSKLTAMLHLPSTKLVHNWLPPNIGCQTLNHGNSLKMIN